MSAPSFISTATSLKASWGVLPSAIALPYTSAICSLAIGVEIPNSLSLLLSSSLLTAPSAPNTGLINPSPKFLALAPWLSRAIWPKFLSSGLKLDSLWSSGPLPLGSLAVPDSICCVCSKVCTGVVSFFTSLTGSATLVDAACGGGATASTAFGLSSTSYSYLYWPVCGSTFNTNL